MSPFHFVRSYKVVCTKQGTDNLNLGHNSNCEHSLASPNIKINMRWYSKLQVYITPQIYDIIFALVKQQR